MAIKIRWSLLRNPSTTIPMQFSKHFTKMFDLLPSLFLQVIHNKSEMMIKIQYLHREGNSNYCICPDVIVTALSSSIKQKSMEEMLYYVNDIVEYTLNGNTYQRKLIKFCTKVQ